MDEILGTSVPGGGFAQLLGDPFIDGGASHRGVDDTTGVQFDDDKDEEGTKQQVVDDGEITSPNVLGLVLQESAPGLIAGRGWPELVEVFLNGAFADLNTEFEQFTPNAFGASQRVFLRHLFDEINDLLSNAGFAVLLP